MLEECIVLFSCTTFFKKGRHTPMAGNLPLIGITIGDNIWIGAGASVLDGVKIGRDCIIGTGAVVKSNIPAYSIAVGMPAKVIKNRRNNSGKRRRSRSYSKNPKTQKADNK